MNSEITVADIIENLKNTPMEEIENQPQFEKYLTTKEFTKIHSGMKWAEGPCYIKSHKKLYFSDIPNNHLLSWDGNNIKIEKNPSNFINGNTEDLEGNLISCSHGGRCIYKTDINGNTTTLVDKYLDKKLNSPNDVVVKSDGSIWFTDPPYGILSDYEGYKGDMEYGACYVFRYDPKENNLEVVSKDFLKPNGLAFSVNEDKIYIADSGGSHDVNAPNQIMVYDIIENKILKNGKVFHKFNPFFADGFRVDKDDNVWTSAGKGIKCFNPQGEVIGQLLLPDLVANLTFGGENNNILYVTSSSNLYSMELNQQGK
ncbi:MAG: SMP-30/gluconolactonase/LRE family protein [Alphaproteobacteria bacterium]